MVVTENPKGVLTMTVNVEALLIRIILQAPFIVYLY